MNRLFHRAIYSDKFWKWPALAGLAIVVAVLIAGCGTAQPYWRQVHPAYEEKYISVVRAKSYSELATRCRRPATTSMAKLPMGCVSRMPNLCLIILAPDADRCTLTHERKHCAGFEHPENMALAKDCGDDDK